MQPLSGMTLDISYIFNIPDNNSSGSLLPMCTQCLAVNVRQLSPSEQSDMANMTLEGHRGQLRKQMLPASFVSYLCLYFFFSLPLSLSLPLPHSFKQGRQEI